MKSLLERRAALTAALRSGQYIQGRNRLRLGNEFCCLGVACDIYYKETGNGKWNGSYFKTERRETATVMPPEVRDWFGFVHEAGKFDEFDNLPYSKLDALNDNVMGFMSIADLIDSNPKGMFHD